MRLIDPEQVVRFNKKLCEEDDNEHAVLNEHLALSAVHSAFQQLSGVGFVHGSIPEIAAALCYKLTQNHPFRDGNKRTAAISSIIFLDLNGYEFFYTETDSSTRVSPTGRVNCCWQNISR